MRAPFDNGDFFGGGEDSFSSFGSTFEDSRNNFHQRYNDEAQLAINGLPQTLSESELRNILSQFGNIVNLKLRTDKKYQHQNFAYVTYATVPEAEACLNGLRANVAIGMNFDASHLNVRFYNPKFNRRANLIQSPNLYQNGISPSSSIPFNTEEKYETVILDENFAKTLPNFNAMKSGAIRKPIEEEIDRSDPVFAKYVIKIYLYLENFKRP